MSSPLCGQLQMACECHAVVKNETARLLPGDRAMRGTSECDLSKTTQISMAAFVTFDYVRYQTDKWIICLHNQPAPNGSVPSVDYRQRVDDQTP